MSNKIVIFGTGSFGEVAHFYFTKDSNYEVVAFTVNQDHIKEDKFLGLPVVPFENIENYFPPDKFKMFIAAGYRKVNQIRANIYNEAKRRGYFWVTYISSKCTCWTDKIGDTALYLKIMLFNLLLV